MRATVLLVLMLAMSSSLPAEEPALTYAEHSEPFLQMYCLDCHTGESAESELRLDWEQAPVVSDDVDKWTEILQRVAGHEMPPEDAVQPSDDERRDFLRWIDQGMAQFDCNQPSDEPRVTVRRLNRSEYNFVVSDLLGVSISPADDFPADDVGDGFDNIGEVLSLPPLLMEKYVEAAEDVTRELAARPDVWSAALSGLSRDEKLERGEVRSALRSLANKAFRRPVSDEELRRLMALFDAAVAEGFQGSRAVDLAVQAILISPQFIFRVEEPTVSGDQPTPLDAYGLAARLSFFLWSSLPDDELRQLAAENQLSQTEVLKQQTIRMLQDPKAARFVDNFAGQWLELRQLEKIVPDPELFPSFNDPLRASMVAETKRFFYELMMRDGNLLDLIDSNYSFLNEQLAEHYGIDGVRGPELRRVSLTDDRRGGILTHASILTLTSNPTRTSPVKRGKWILENILGTPPPPPPPNVPELEDEGSELLGSLRERMQQHRENPSCAVCHRKMDALGFGFENFNAVGAWRDKDGRYDIDPAGELPGNVKFQTPAELRSILKTNIEDFTRCLTRKMLTYALGRSLNANDRCVVEDIVADVEKQDHRFSSLVLGIVTSDTFRFSGSSFSTAPVTTTFQPGAE